MSDDQKRRQAAMSLAVKLYQEEVVSMGRAAKMAGVSQEEFMDCLSSMGIPVIDYSPAELRNELTVFNDEDRVLREISEEFGRVALGPARIVSVPGTMGGDPTFEGTRVPAETILSEIRHGSSREQIFADYPSLPPDAIERVLAWERAGKPLPEHNDLVLALDLEATLIVSVGWPWARPGLREFLGWAREAFGRIVIYTAAPEPEARRAMEFVAGRGDAPAWFGGLEVLRPVLLAEEDWADDVDEIVGKDLRVLGDPARAFLVDDYRGYVLPAQRDRWVEITPFAGEPRDQELARVRGELERRSTG